MTPRPTLAADWRWRGAIVVALCLATGAPIARADDPSEREPNYWRTFGEMTLCLAGGTIWYWLDKERNVADWDFDSWTERFDRHAWRYDNNTFAINFTYHALSGAGFYALSRANDLNVGASLISAFLTSMAWEYLLEFREKISINDVMVTPGAGLAFGEFFHKLGTYLTSAAGHEALAWTAGLPVRLHQRFDGERPQQDVVLDRFGFAAGWDRRFDLRAGIAWIGGDGDAGPAGEVAFDGRLSALPGRGDIVFADADVASLRARATFGAGRWSFETYSDVIIFGLHRRAELDGRGADLVLGSSVDYFKRRDDLPGWRDDLGVFGFPGVGLDVHAFGRRGGIFVSARVHGDFAGIHSAPFAQWDEPDETPKTILARHGYYYGWGWSMRLELRASLFGSELGLRVWRGSHASHEGFDRSQEEVTADLEAHDVSRDVEAWLLVPLHASGIYAGIMLRHQRRESTLEELAVDRELFVLSASLGVRR